MTRCALRLAALLLLMGAASTTAPGAAAQPSPTPSQPAKVEGARRWEIPGGSFLLPDWQPFFTIIEKGMGVIGLRRASDKAGGVCLTWTYQASPLTVKELGEVAPAFLGLLQRLPGLSADSAPPFEAVGNGELDVIAGHPTVKIMVRRPAASTASPLVEGILAIWDCPSSHRTYGFYGYAPSRAISNQIVYAVGKYARCHASPVDYASTGPVRIDVPQGWKTVSIGPTQHVLATADESAAAYLFMMALSDSDRVTKETTSSLVDSLSLLVGKLIEKKEAAVSPDAGLGHPVGSIEARLNVGDREAHGAFEFWFCPRRLRLFARVLLAPSADELAKLRPVLSTVRCHEAP